MKIQTFSILAGSTACNAKCPFCISKMTPKEGVTLKEPEVNWRNFSKACLLAKQGGVNAAMITGKGEPTLYPKQITKYLTTMEPFEFPIIELQTNGILIAENKKEYDEHLRDWYAKGLTTIAISIVHYEPEKNKEIYLPHKESYINLPDLIKQLHDKNISVRLSCIMADGYICDSKSLEELILFSKENKVEQLTVRPVNKPQNSGDFAAEKWVLKHYIKPEQKEVLQNYVIKNGHQLMKLQHGATIYDVHGQNICLTSSLTLEPNSEDIRQLIFFPDGHLRYDWQYEGAILL
jgi:molybdenum cofactor biosynthesis enzyme MoaA